MERDCPKYNELSSILGDRCKDAARPYNTGQNSEEAFVLYHPPPENPVVSFPDEKEAPLVSSTSGSPSHLEPSPVPGPSFLPIALQYPTPDLTKERKE